VPQGEHLGPVPAGVAPARVCTTVARLVPFWAMSDAEEPAARFERVVREYGPPLTRLAATYTRGAMDQDDLPREILFALWRALSSFRGPTGLTVSGRTAL
jgi:Sigma-70 region 2